ncbi:MAG: hypothetical protein ACFFC7_21725 [Candidatus Hermodarchaeota archaeon]
MSLVATKSTLNDVRPQTFNLEELGWNDFDYLIEKLSPNWEVISIQPERQEILLKARNGALWDPEEIREYLQELQLRTHRSYVALMNSARQYALITIRG